MQINKRDYLKELAAVYTQKTRLSTEAYRHLNTYDCLKF